MSNLNPPAPAGYRPYRRLRAVPVCHPQHERYEREKRAWVFEHPEHTPAEYTAAMRRISRECNV